MRISKLLAQHFASHILWFCSRIDIHHAAWLFPQFSLSGRGTTELKLVRLRLIHLSICQSSRTSCSYETGPICTTACVGLLFTFLHEKTDPEKHRAQIVHLASRDSGELLYFQSPRKNCRNRPKILHRRRTEMEVWRLNSLSA